MFSLLMCHYYVFYLFSNLRNYLCEINQKSIICSIIRNPIMMRLIIGVVIIVENGKTN